MALTNLLPVSWSRRGITPAASRMPSFSGSRDDPFTQLQSDINTLFDSFFGSDGWMVSPFETGAATLSAMRPMLDVSESENAYTIAVDMPGVDQNDIELSVDEDTLILSAKRERKAETGDKESQFHRAERSFGRYERMLTLPADADADAISANYRNGVLEIEIPRRKDVATQRGRKIEIKNTK